MHSSWFWGLYIESIHPPFQHVTYENLDRSPTAVPREKGRPTVPLSSKREEPLRRSVVPIPFEGDLHCLGSCSSCHDALQQLPRGRFEAALTEKMARTADRARP